MIERVTRRIDIKKIRQRSVRAAVAIGLAVGLGTAHAHQYCKACVQTCKTSVDTGCEVWYGNPGVYTKGTCSGGGTTCAMQYNTRCYTTKKICSYSACVNDDCESTACTTYVLSAIDGATTFNGATACN